MNRRDFLKGSGKGALLLAGLPLASACSGTKREDLGRFERTQKPIKGLENDEKEILYLASLAPSSHNAQPWTVRIQEPRHWIIGSDPKRWLPSVDPENRELLLGIGAFIENLVIAAGTFGYEAEIQILAENPLDTDLAAVHLKKGKTRDFPLEKIRKRRTLRADFSADKLKKEDLRFITRHDDRPCLLSNIPSPHAFYFPNDSREGNYLQKATIAANRAQAFRDAAQEELSQWIRWSNEEAKQFRDGLTPESMEIKGFAGWYVRTFYNRKSVLKQGFREQTVDLVIQQVKTCGGWLVVTSPDSRVSTLVEYGRVYEEMLLKIREKNIAIHPMTQLLEEDPWKKEIIQELGLTGHVQWILRAGYPESYPEPVSVRRPLSWFVMA